MGDKFALFFCICNGYMIQLKLPTIEKDSSPFWTPLLFYIHSLKKFIVVVVAQCLLTFVHDGHFIKVILVFTGGYIFIVKVLILLCAIWKWWNYQMHENMLSHRNCIRSEWWWMIRNVILKKKLYIYSHSYFLLGSEIKYYTEFILCCCASTSFFFREWYLLKEPWRKRNVDQDKRKEERKIPDTGLVFYIQSIKRGWNKDKKREKMTCVAVILVTTIEEKSGMFDIIFETFESWSVVQDSRGRFLCVLFYVENVFQNTFCIKGWILQLFTCIVLTQWNCFRFCFRNKFLLL